MDTTFPHPWVSPGPPDKIFVISPHGFYTNYLRINQEGPIYKTTNDIIAHHILEVLPQPYNTRFYLKFRAALQTRRPQYSSVQFSEPSPFRAEVHLIPYDNNVLAIARDYSPTHSQPILIHHPVPPEFIQSIFTTTIAYSFEENPEKIQEWLTLIHNLAIYSGVSIQQTENRPPRITLQGHVSAITNLWLMLNSLKSLFQKRTLPMIHT